MQRAEELLKKEVHSSVVVEGYQEAAAKTLEILASVGKKVEFEDEETLTKVAVTSMQSKMVSEDSDTLAKTVVDAVLKVVSKDGGSYSVDLDNIKVEKKAGATIRDTAMIEGIVLDKETVHPNMRFTVNNARIALLNTALEVEKTEMSAEIRITDPTQMQMFLEEENKMLKEMVQKIRNLKANVLLCQKGIDDIAQHYLAKNRIMAVRRIKESDMTKLQKATGGRVTTNIDDLTEKDLGTAATVQQKTVDSDKWVFIEGCKNPQSVTILVRGGSQRIVDEVDRSLHDALMVVKDVIENPFIVAGGGSIEAHVASQLKAWADSFDGREQLAIKKYAEALETIPLTIAENAGMDPIDSMANLRTAQNQNKMWTGIDARNAHVADMMEMGVIEPVAVKEQIVNSATEAACMILRIDDVIAVSGGPTGPGRPTNGINP